MTPTRLAATSTVAALAIAIALGGDPPAATGASPRGGEPGALPAGGPGGAWRLVFRDEFSGSSLDRSTWRPNWFGSTARAVTDPVDIAHSDTCVDPRMTTVSGGELRLTVERRRCHGHDYAGALVSSNPAAGGQFGFTYGYIEFRAILPAEDGIWSALWINGQTWPADGEIDVLESGLPWASRQKWHYHDSTIGVAGGRVAVPDASTAWHSYAAFWEPGRVSWYYDGALVSTIVTGEIGVPHYVVMNAADWLAADPSGPGTTRIDHVRVWQRNLDPLGAKTASALVSGRTLVVTAAAGAADNLRIRRLQGSKLRVTDHPGGPYTGSALRAGAGCSPSGPRAATCHGAIARVRVMAGDRPDRVVNSTGLRSSLRGGSAKDTLIGGRGKDAMIGGPGADVMKGRRGDDLLRARDLTSDQLIDCDGAVGAPGRADKARLDKLPKDRDSAVAGCERRTRR